MAIKSIISDLYGVVLHRDEAVMKSDFVRASSLPEADVVRAIEEAGRAAFKIGQISPEDYVAGLNSKLGTTLSLEEVLFIWNRSLRIDNQMLDLLVNLSERGLKVLLLSNLNFFDWTDAGPMGLSRFESILSYKVGMKKPDPKIFQLALSFTQLPAASHVYIDDQMKNIKVAQEAGMQATQFQGYDALVARLKEAEVL